MIAFLSVLVFPLAFALVTATIGLMFASHGSKMLAALKMTHRVAPWDRPAPAVHCRMRYQAARPLARAAARPVHLLSRVA